jgi:hypothetical protein
MSESHRPLIARSPAPGAKHGTTRAALAIAALSLLALSGCVAYPYGYGGYAYAPGYYAAPIVVGGGYYGGWRRWR